MKREDQIIYAAKYFEKKEGFSPIVMKAKGVNSAAGIGFLEGAVWADKTLIGQIEQLLLTDVLPHFIHGGEADEVIAMLDEKIMEKYL